MKLRHCSRCDETQPLVDFARDRTQSTGYKWHCKVCDVKRGRQIRANRELAPVSTDHALRPVACRCPNPAISEDYDGDRVCVLCGRFETVALEAA